MKTSVGSEMYNNIKNQQIVPEWNKQTKTKNNPHKEFRDSEKKLSSLLKLQIKVNKTVQEELSNGAGKSNRIRSTWAGECVSRVS